MCLHSAREWDNAVHKCSNPHPSSFSTPSSLIPPVTYGDRKKKKEYIVDYNFIAQTTCKYLFYSGTPLIRTPEIRTVVAVPNTMFVYCLNPEMRTPTPSIDQNTFSFSRSPGLEGAHCRYVLLHWPHLHNLNHCSHQLEAGCNGPQSTASLDPLLTASLSHSLSAEILREMLGRDGEQGGAVSFQGHFRRLQEY